MPFSKNFFTKNIFVLLLALCAGLTAGILGSVSVFTYLSKNSSCPCQNVEAGGEKKTLLTLPELTELRKSLDMKEDIQMNAVYKTVSPSIVGIFQMKKGEEDILENIYTLQDFLGGGAALTNDGWIITTQEVAGRREPADLVVVHHGEIFLVTDRVVDPYSGLVFLKTESKNLSAVEFVSRDVLNIGQSVIVVHPIYGPRLAHIVNLHMKPLSQGQNFLESTDRISEYILLDIPLSDPSEGEVVVDFDGRVIGITMINSPTKSGQVVSADFIRPVIKGVLRSKKIERPYFGVEYIDISRAVGVKDKIEGDRKQGALVYRIPDRSSPAFVAGIQRNDIILSINGEAITPPRTLSEIIQEYQVGDTLEVSLIRQREEKLLEVYLGLLKEEGE